MSKSEIYGNSCLYGREFETVSFDFLFCDGNKTHEINKEYRGIIEQFKYNPIPFKKEKEREIFKNIDKYYYDTKYSAKFIYDDYSLFELRDLLEELKINKFLTKAFFIILFIILPPTMCSDIAEDLNQTLSLMIYDFHQIHKGAIYKTPPDYSEQYNYCRSSS